MVLQAFKRFIVVLEIDILEFCFFLCSSLFEKLFNISHCLKRGWLIVAWLIQNYNSTWGWKMHCNNSWLIVIRWWVYPLDIDISEWSEDVFFKPWTDSYEEYARLVFQVNDGA